MLLLRLEGSADMYVCICKGVTEKTIQEAAKSGVNDYKSLRDKTGVASQCGKCGSDAKNCLRQHAISQ